MSDDNNLKIERGRAWWGDFREENFGFTIFDEIGMISFDGSSREEEKYWKNANFWGFFT